MIAIADTNFLIKYFSSKIEPPNNSVKVFEDSNTFLIVPSIVLVELKYIAAKGRISSSILDKTYNLLKAGNCMLYPLDLKLIDFIPTELNIHDGIIFATAYVIRSNFEEDVYILTKDREMKNLKQDKVKVIW